MAGPKKQEKDPEIAKPYDLKSLERKNATAQRRERLLYLFASGKRPRDIGPTPPEDEQEFWKQQIIENPFILCRYGAYLIKTKEGYKRYFPGNEQTELTEWREHCWKMQWVCDIWELKCRQYGGSTEAKLADLSVAIAASLMTGGVYCYTVGNEVKNTRKMLRIIRTAIKGMPLWLRPTLSRDSDDYMEIDDEDRGMLGIQFQADTAKAGEEIGRGDPAQIRHYTEADWWWDPEGAFAALEAAQVWTWPAHQTTETTGKKSGSVFQSQYEAAKKPDPNNPGRKSFFFPWYRHEHYRKALPKGQAIEEFWVSMADDDRLRFEAHGCDHEQANWYLWKRQSQIDKRIPLDLFRREFPFDDVEAFLGGTFTVFSVDKLAKARDAARFFRRGRLEEMLLTAYPAVIPPDWEPKFTRVRIAWQHDQPEAIPRMEPDIQGDAYVWERHRQSHDYVISADISENKLAKPGIIESGDWLNIEVGRTTYDPRIDRAVIAQVLQLRSKFAGVLEAARICVALSMLYPSRYGKRTPIIFERNMQGLAFEIEVKRLRGKMYSQYKRDGLKNHFVGYGIQATRGDTGVGSKNNLVAQFREAFETDQMAFRSMETLTEMGRYTRDEKGVYGAPPGEHDDAVSGGYLLAENARESNRGILQPIPVSADGGVNLAQQPGEDEIDTARAESAFSKRRPKDLAGTGKRRTGGWRGGI